MTGVKIAQAMALVVPAVQDYKVRAQRRTDGETTLPPTVIALREDRVLCVATTPRLEASLACAPTMAVGLAPQFLICAAQGDLGNGTTAIVYTLMSAQREAATAVQPFRVEGEGAQAQVRFGTPQKGTPTDRGVMDVLAAALTLEPMDASRVARTQDVPDEAAIAAGERPPYLPLEQGRLAIDAGTVRGLQDKVGAAGGTVLYLAGSPQEATRVVGYGMPQQALLGAQPE